MTDYRLTFDQLDRIAREHGCAGVLCHGNKAASLRDQLGEEDGHCRIRRHPKTGLFSLNDTREALGY
ncbi:hypothetical protein CDO87_03490 [Sagittula sp. P11]|uniref:hypothetical protein n=1 Tax=Sagittula sp. P11 TaxID=2009329 RepID=UPI000C2D1DD6|nr:hypothetical protein [Sagittula sp. P11]AUC52307.1 hypothetical protein CDO87_03490 [Sagittula sp. P11]